MHWKNTQTQVYGKFNYLNCNIFTAKRNDDAAVGSAAAAAAADVVGVLIVAIANICHRANYSRYCATESIVV